MEVVPICDNLDNHLGFLEIYIARKNAMAVVQLFETAIIRGAKKAYYFLLPHVNENIKHRAVELLAMYGDENMMAAIHEKGPYNFDHLNFTMHPLWVAVSFDNYDVARWMLELGYSWKYEVTLYNAIVHVNVKMLELFHRHNLEVDIASMLMYTLRHVLCSEGPSIYPLDATNYDAESLEFLFFLHENYSIYFSGEYNWECNKGEPCYLCNEALKRKTF